MKTEVLVGGKGGTKGREREGVKRIAKGGLWRCWYKSKKGRIWGKGGRERC